jgi:hypothetical protein
MLEVRRESISGNFYSLLLEGYIFTKQKTEWFFISFFHGWLENAKAQRELVASCF